MYSGIRRALIARLTGRPLTEVDEALKGGQGAALPLGSGSTHTPQPMHFGVSRAQPDESRGPENVIQVFPFDLTGTNINTWPAVGVSLAELTPRETNYQWRDPIRRDVLGTEKTVRTYGGEVVRANIQTVREHPRPYDLGFHIRIDATTETDMALITERVYSLLDYKGYLEVELRSGEKVTYDTVLQAPLAPRKDTATVQGNGAGAYTHRLLYRVEAYVDNSEAVQLMRLISRVDFTGNGRKSRFSEEVIQPETPQASNTGLLLIEDGDVLLIENGNYLELG